MIYGHSEVIGLLEDMAGKLLHEKQTQFIGRRLHLVAVEDGEQQTILGRPVTFFDIGSTKDQQFGFSMEIGRGENGLPAAEMNPTTTARRGTSGAVHWLLHEAFCLSQPGGCVPPL